MDERRSRTRLRTLIGSLTLVVVVLAALSPAAAQASKLKGLSTGISYRAANGEQNDLTVGPSAPPVAPGNYRFSEPTVAISNVSISLCQVVDASNLDCPSTSVAKIRASLRNGNDNFKATGTVPVVVSGGAGRDYLIGSDSGDRIAGGRDNDEGPVIVVGPDAGKLSAGIVGGNGADLLRGGAGADVLESFDNGTVDKVSCGPGVDTVYADAVDIIKPDCEAEGIHIGPGPKEGEPDGPVDPNNTNTTTNTTTTIVVPGDNGKVNQNQAGDPCPSGVRALGKSAKAKGKRVKIKLRAPGDAKATCKGKVRIDALVKRAHGSAKPRLRIGSASFSVGPGKTKTIKVKLTKSGRKLLKQRGKLKVRANVFTYRKVVGAATSSKITKKKLVIRAAKRR